MKRVGIAVTAAALAGFLGLGGALAQQTQTYDRGWSHMMMGPMAGCPMGAGQQGMMGPYMMGPGMMGDHMMGPGMMGDGHMMGWGHMGQWNQGSASTAPQLDSLRSALAIRRDQQDEWDAYVAAASADSQSMFDMHNRMMGFMQNQATTAPDWLGVHREMMRTRADSLDALAGATERLYRELDAGQKATFDRYGGGMCGQW